LTGSPERYPRRPRLPDKCVKPERFLNKVFIRIEYFILYDGGGRVTRHEDYFYSRANRLQTLRQFNAVHFRQHHVRQHKQDYVRIFCQRQLYALKAICGGRKDGSGKGILHGNI